MPADISPAHRELLASRKHGVLATLKKDGRPQLSNVSYTYDDATGLVRISVTDSRAKTRNLRRDARASLHVETPDGWGYAVAEGIAELTPVATTPDDATVEELIDVYRAVGGEHPNWAEYRQAMVDDGRLVIKLPVTRTYGT
jgi:PPOX class probable F420-dependent enzyme